MRRILSVLAAFLLLYATATPVSAASYSLAPSRPNVQNKESFSIIRTKLVPGKKTNADVDLINTSNKEQKVYLLSNTDKNSVVNLVTPVKAITLPKNSRTTVAFEIQARKNARDGEYSYYLYLSPDPKSLFKQTAPSLQVITNVGNKVEKKLEIVNSSFSFYSAALLTRIKVKNVGSTPIDALGIKLFLKGTIPILTADQEFYWGETVTIAPGTTKEISYRIPQSVPLLTNSAVSVEIDYAGKTTARKDSTVFHVNQEKALWYGVSTLLLAAVLIFALKTNYLSKLLTKIKTSVKLPSFSLFQKSDLSHFLHNKQEPPQEAAAPTAGAATTSQIDNVGIEGMIKNIMKEEEAIISAKELSYDKIFFEVRKIVRQEIELWKEIDRFRHEVREQLVREEQVKKRLKEELSKN